MSSIHLSHFLGVVVEAEYEKMENEYLLYNHLIVENKIINNNNYNNNNYNNNYYNNKSNDNNNKDNNNNNNNNDKNNDNKNNSTDSTTSDSELSQAYDVVNSTTASCCPQLDLTTDVKRKRPKYSDDQQRRVIEIYDSFSCKVMAMKAINQMHGFESIYKRKIERWKRSNKSMGRPVSREFEMEVIEEFRNTLISINNNKSNKQLEEEEVVVNAIMTNSTLKKCALSVFDRQYWDETTKSFVQKWHVDRLTCNLCFTSKWIAGLLKRSKKTINSSSGSSTSSSSSGSSTSSSSGSGGGSSSHLIWSDGGGCSYSPSSTSSTAPAMQLNYSNCC